MTHKHQCSKGHIWEHGPTPTKGVTEAEWKLANDKAHTCAICGEGVYTRLQTPDELERLTAQAMALGKRNAVNLLEHLAEIDPDMELPEVLATISEFAKFGSQALELTHVARNARNLFAPKAKPDNEFRAAWNAQFGDKFPNPFTPEGVQKHG